jgi:hypothetical protein
MSQITLREHQQRKAIRDCRASQLSISALTIEESGLLAAYRATDERGKHAIEESARFQVAYTCRPVPQQQDNVVPLRR